MWPRGTKELCLKLRVDQRASYSQITAKTGVPKGTLAGWLRGYPLTFAERQALVEVGSSKGRQRARGVNRKPRGMESDLHKTLAKPASITVRSRVAEAAVLLRLAVHGFEVHGPQFDGSKSDWLIDRPDLSRPVRVQVKLTRRHEKRGGLPNIVVTCSDGRTRQRRYKPGEVDVFIGYDLFTDVAYVWRYDSISGKRSLSICPEAEERWDLISF